MARSDRRAGGNTQIGGGAFNRKHLIVERGGDRLVLLFCP
jgi:hypothetical protein